MALPQNFYGCPSCIRRINPWFGIWGDRAKRRDYESGLKIDFWFESILDVYSSHVITDNILDLSWKICLTQRRLIFEWIALTFYLFCPRHNVGWARFSLVHTYNWKFSQDLSSFGLIFSPLHFVKLLMWENLSR